jgi:hypothetical protein
MSETKREYAANYRKPPLHTRFKKGQSSNPRGRSKKKLHALLTDALSEQVCVTIDGERRQITRRSSISWSTNPPPPICGRPRCCST